MVFPYKYHYGKQENAQGRREKLTENFILKYGQKSIGHTHTHTHTHTHIYIYIYIIILKATCFGSTYRAENYGEKNLEQLIMENNI